MQFLRTVFWAIVAAAVALFCWVNGSAVTINLWNNLQADIKLPLLLFIVFLIGFLPTWLILRAKIWSLQRRLEAAERNRLAALPPERPVEEVEPVI